LTLREQELFSAGFGILLFRWIARHPRFGTNKKGDKSQGLKTARSAGLTLLKQELF